MAEKGTRYCTVEGHNEMDNDNDGASSTEHSIKHHKQEHAEEKKNEVDLPSAFKGKYPIGYKTYPLHSRASPIRYKFVKTMASHRIQSL